MHSKSIGEYRVINAFVGLPSGGSQRQFWTQWYSALKTLIKLCGSLPNILDISSAVPRVVWPLRINFVSWSISESCWPSSIWWSLYISSKRMQIQIDWSDPLPKFINRIIARLTQEGERDRIWEGEKEKSHNQRAGSWEVERDYIHNKWPHEVTALLTVRFSSFVCYSLTSSFHQSMECFINTVLF